MKTKLFLLGLLLAQFSWAQPPILRTPATTNLFPVFSAYLTNFNKILVTNEVNAGSLVLGPWAEFRYDDGADDVVISNLFTPSYLRLGSFLTTDRPFVAPSVTLPGGDVQTLISALSAYTLAVSNFTYSVSNLNFTTKVAIQNGVANSLTVTGLTGISQVGGTIPALLIRDTNGNPFFWSSTNFSGVVRLGSNVNGYLTISNNPPTTNTSFASGGNAPSLYLDAGGNVGIGTATPTNKLQVIGGIIADAYTSPYRTNDFYGFGSAGTMQTVVGGASVQTINNDRVINGTSVFDGWSSARRYLVGGSTNGFGAGTTTPSGTLNASNGVFYGLVSLRNQSAAIPNAAAIGANNGALVCSNGTLFWFSTTDGSSLTTTKIAP